MRGEMYGATERSKLLEENYDKRDVYELSNSLITAHRAVIRTITKQEWCVFIKECLLFTEHRCAVWTKALKLLY